MKRIFISVAAVAVLLSGASPSQANFVVANSTYEVEIFDSADGAAVGNFLVNGLTQSLVYHGVTVDVTLTQTNLGGGYGVITVDLSANSDIFPTVGTGYGFVSIGGYQQIPLDLSQTEDLSHAYMTYTNGGDTVVASGDLINLVQNTTPWDGFFNAQGMGAAISGTTGADVQNIQLQFDVGPPASVAPAPSGLILLAVGIACMAGYAWRRRQTLEMA